MSRALGISAVSVLRKTDSEVHNELPLPAIHRPCGI